MNDLEKLLNEVGLEHQEAKVYLSALQLGTSPASVIGKQLNIPRSTARYTCEQLIKKQLMVPMQKGNTVFFTAENPEKLVKLLDLKREDIDLKEASLSKNMPDLISLYNPDTVLPRVTFYEGINGVGESLDKVVEDLEAGDEICIYGSARTLDRDKRNGKFISALDRFMKKRIKKKINLKLLTTIFEGSMRLKLKDEDNYRETRFSYVNHEAFLSSEIIIYKDKVYSMAKEGNSYFATIIQSKHLCDVHRAIFDIAWKQAKKDDQEICKSDEYKKLKAKIAKSPRKK